jgi:hypothetical protein
MINKATTAEKAAPSKLAEILHTVVFQKYPSLQVPHCVVEMETSI